MSNATTTRTARRVRTSINLAPEAFAAALRRAGMNQGDLAREVGISKGFLSRALNHREITISPRTAGRIAAALDVDVNTITISTVTTEIETTTVETTSTVTTRGIAA